MSGRILSSDERSVLRPCSYMAQASGIGHCVERDLQVLWVIAEMSDKRLQISEMVMNRECCFIDALAASLV